MRSLVVRRSTREKRTGVNGARTRWRKNFIRWESCEAHEGSAKPDCEPVTPEIAISYRMASSESVMHPPLRRYAENATLCAVSDETEDRELAIIQKHVDALGEHFDSVQIFVTRHDAAIEDGTVSANLGSGNWFARYGQTREWVVKNDERARESVRHEDD